MKNVADVKKYALALVLAVALLALMLPAAVHASGQLVTIVDRDGTTKAAVDRGKLRVGDGDGAMTVNGVLTDSHRGRTPYEDVCTFQTSSAEPDPDFDWCEFDPVPADKVLVITQISADVTVPDGQTVWHFMIDSQIRASPSGDMILGADQNVLQGSVRHYIYDHHTEVPLAPGTQFRAAAARAGTSGGFAGRAIIFGYLTNP